MNGDTILLSIFLGFLAKCYSEKPGPFVRATRGGVWPKPQQQNVSEDYFVFRPKSFQFELAKSSSNCNFLQNGLERYSQIVQENTKLIEKSLKYRSTQNQPETWLKEETFLDYIDKLTVNLTGVCEDDEFPTIDMDESYKLWVTTIKAELQANSIWGILRGLETFSQLIYLGNDGLSLRLNSTVIEDYPRYKHRGLLIDTARHYLPLDKIYETLDALSYNKMNVLHWHIVDDQSFPYVSRVLPELSERGAFNSHTHIYNPEDIRNVIEYARQRGIRVIPEFDTPGHTASWGLSHPEILTYCPQMDWYGPMDPSKEETFSILNLLLTEVRELFTDDYVHLGGDEVEFFCWSLNNNITEFMKKQNIETYEGLESYYMQKVLDMTDQLKFKSIVWQEVFTNGVKIPNDTLVQVWNLDWTSTMTSVTSAGYQGLLSTCWYLDHLSSGRDWDTFYLCEPTEFNGTPEQQKLVLGGEACMWGESVNEYNIISRVWPRASATAEKLWSAKFTDYNTDEPASRLEEHACRMNRRGIAAQPPNAAGYCD